MNNSFNMKHYRKYLEDEPYLKKDRDFMMDAIKQDANKKADGYRIALDYLHNSLKNDKRFMLNAVKLDYRALGYASDSLRADEDVVMEAVKHSGTALEYADNSLKKDKDIVLAAVKQDGWALEYADDSLKKDKNFLLRAYHVNPEIINIFRYNKNFEYNDFNYVQKKRRNNKRNLGSFLMSGPGYNKKEMHRKIKGREFSGKKIPKSVMDRISGFVSINSHNQYHNNYGGSQFINVPNHGKRKVRYQKNGRAYVIVKGKKIKL